MATGDQPGNGWMLVHRRQPARMAEGRPEGGYTAMFETICCDCGDHPDPDYSRVSPELQRIRGPNPTADGISAYVEHAGPHRHPARATSLRRGRMQADRR